MSDTNGNGSNGKGDGRFVKGDPRIQHGAHALPPEIKRIRRLSAIEFFVRFNKYVFTPVKSLKIMLDKSDELDALDVVFVRALVKAGQSGEYEKFLREIMDRILGRPKATVMIDPTPNGEPDLTPEEIAAYESELHQVFPGLPQEPPAPPQPSAEPQQAAP